MIDSILMHLRKSAEKYPNKTVYYDTRSGLTFSELSHHVKATATYIAKIASYGEPVAVMTGRHVYTPACFLGIAAAGCFYVPMDPSMPTIRLNQILSVADPRFIIVDSDNLDRLSELDFHGQIIEMEHCFETDPDPALLIEAEAQITENTPLYLLFTSGSSGTPKGVLTSHGALMCYLDGLNRVIDLDENDVLGNQSPLDYIAAIRDMYLPLMCGGRTVIIPPSCFAMPNLLFGLFNEYKVTTLCWSSSGIEIPAKMGGFDDQDPDNLPKHLKRIVFSGSVISNKYLRIWQDNLPEVVFINQYGPTEATGSCSWYKITEPVHEDTVIPIGKPYDHYQIMLLDDNNHQITDSDIQGEICIKGPALSLGYYADMDQTSRSFVQNPVNSKYREIIYRTGDLGKYRDDGQLMFLGRMDRQVKHMGHRVELDDVEFAAMKIRGVRECCCVYDSNAKKIILGYSGAIEKKELATSLRTRLPDFMVPRKIIKVEDFPHLPNGKLDRKSFQKELIKNV